MKRFYTFFVMIFTIAFLICGASEVSQGQVCKVGDVINPGESCQDPGTGKWFRIFQDEIDGEEVTGVTFYTSGGIIHTDVDTFSEFLDDSNYFEASKRNNGSWEIKSVTRLKPIPTKVIDPGSPPIYWAAVGSGRIQRATLNGSNVENLISGSGAPSRVALDMANSKIYWSEAEIKRADLNGKNIELLVPGVRFPGGIALDVVSGKMYWGESILLQGAHSSKILRSNLNGTNIEILVSGLINQSGLALDVAGGKMYWGESLSVNSPSRIKRSNLNGTNIEILIPRLDLSGPRSLALDVSSGKMYWTAGYSRRSAIMRANLNGTNIETLVSGVDSAVGIALGISRGIDVPEPISLPEPVEPISPPRSSEVISIPDANLAKAVRKALGLDPNARITKQALQGLTRLDARESQIKNLTGLEHATGLSVLELRDNQISNIRPLVNLKNLKELILDNNRVSNIRSFANMKQLTWLLIGKNPISNFTPLRNLTQLRGLSFWGNDVSDVMLFAGLPKLTHLWLGANKISNIAPLADLVNLELLSLHDNRIRDVSPLAKLVNLETLELKGNPIQNSSLLASLTKLRDVDIDIHQRFVPATGTRIAIRQPRGLAVSQFTIKPGAFAILVHRGTPSVTGGTDFNDYYYLGEKKPQDPQNPDFPNLARFFQEGGRIELVSHATINPLPRDSGEARFGDVIITEIMWGLDGQSPAKQYIELYNASAYTYTFTDADLSFRFSKVSEAPLPDGTFAPFNNPNVRVKVIDRVSNKGWQVPGKNGDVSQNRSLVSMYRTIDYTTGEVPDGTLASSWKASRGRVNLPPPSYGTPGAKHLPPRPTVLVEASERPPMYWINTNSGTLHRLVGAEVENLVPSVRNATDLVVDVGGGKLYWTERTSDRTGKIRRANLDGTNVQLVRELTSVPHGIALDAAGGKIYLTNAWGKIQRLNIDGSNFLPNLITELDMPRGLTLDVSGGKVYWTEGTGRVRRSNLDGSNIENLPAGSGEPMNIAVSDSAVYWTVKTGEASGEIRSANLSGSPKVATYAEFDQGFPIGIAVDSVAEKLYWTISRGKIGRGNIDESSFQPDVVTGLTAPGVFALSVEPPLVVETPEILPTDAVVRISDSPIVSPAVGNS